ncbi:MAG: hydroxysqualene dehydroxylase HpnE [Acidobacteriota bacterium]|nr:hydroxysqualene dehydroxylase HpnE [Acidobacteriota bacterium]
MQGTSQQDVIVVGAGVAGLSAALALAGSGARVTVLERRPYVGGRACSYLHPALDEVVDSQHVMVGCCVNLVELSAAAGLTDKIRWYDEQTFLEPGGRSSRIGSSVLPAPLQYAPSFLGAGMLSLSDKLGMARGLLEFFRGYPQQDDEDMETWLRRTGQSERSIRHFWSPILMATLNDRPSMCSTRYAGKVFHELFVKSSQGGRLGIPTVPLSEFYQGFADHLVQLGGRVELRASVDSLVQRDGRWCVTAAGTNYEADTVVLALPFEQTRRLLPALHSDHAAAGEVVADLDQRAQHLVHSPFTSILLWYDREICTLDHAWLLDTTIEWFFHKSRIRRSPQQQGSYVELVIAGSRAQLEISREQILTEAQRELALFFPEVKQAKLRKSGILKDARATFSVTTGLDAVRPQQRTALPGLFLAGDWTQTEWPATMEGAARSGRLAAGEVVGRRDRFMAPELPAEGLMRLLL